MVIRKESTINEIIHCYPDTVQFFSDLNMSCSSCFAVRFDTLENGALMHGMDVGVLIQKLKLFIENSPAAVTPLYSKA
tara:strand:- start:6716 stop:6949 length:234 start_codon:yes stop_codon:yes gene_type:complete